MDEIHGLLGGQERRHATCDEKTDHLTFDRLDLFAGDRQLGRDAGESQRTLDRVVVGQRDAVEIGLARASDQLFERALSVVRIVRMEMEVDPQHSAAV